jgi:hypothetical protein
METEATNRMLNDRIAQTIDALNQVRLTTHGLQHSEPLQQQGAPRTRWRPGLRRAPAAYQYSPSAF